MSDEIIWLNHAGYELRTAGLRIVHDPWISGSAFAGGWALVAESKFSSADFTGVDYIWFSHEHPDHFSPEVLRAIAPEVRAAITVLFQKTRDGRVAAFCRKLGFPVQELPIGERVALRNGVHATCGTRGIDSWLFLESPERTYFNANDVVGVDWKAIAARLGKGVDVLLTQFSYANWVGNAGDDDQMKQAAVEKLAEMDAQIAAFKPSILIPFASFVWFSRPENFHLNAGANRIDDIWTRYREHIETVVLYPGDRYTPGSPFPSQQSVARYIADWSAHDCPLSEPDPVVPIDELLELSRVQQEKLKQVNLLWALKPLFWTGFIKPQTIYLSDLDIGITYSIGGGIVNVDVDKASCEVHLLSSCFAAMLKNGYGYGTIAINGRLAETRPGAWHRLSRHFSIPAQNEQGDAFPQMFFRKKYIAWKLRELLR